jgi:hypothetical protein
VRAESSSTVVVKFELVETCSRYDVAPVDAPQLSVGLSGIPVAPSAGNASVGTDGAVGAEVIVVKFQVPENVLHAVTFPDLTCQ